MTNEQLIDDSYYWNLYLLFRQTHDAVMHCSKKEMSRYGLSSEQAKTLIVIQSLGEEATPAEIARLTLREPNTVSILLGRLEDKGLIIKTFLPDNNKMKKVSLTEKGIEAYQNAVKMESIRGILSFLPQRKQRQLYKIMEAIKIRALNVLQKDPYPDDAIIPDE